MAARCCCPPDRRCTGASGLAGQADAFDRRADGRPVDARETSCDAAPGDATRRHELPNGGGRVDLDDGALGEIAEPLPFAEGVRRLVEESTFARGGPLEAEGEAHECRLASAVRTCDADELAGAMSRSTSRRTAGPPDREADLP